MRRPALLMIFLAASLPLPGCGGGSPTVPIPTPTPLGPTPTLLRPINGAETTSDTPTFSAQNAQGYDLGEAIYVFRIFTRSGSKELASFTVPAGRTTTTAVPPSPLPRGMGLNWRAVARRPDGQESASAPASFRLPPVECLASANRYAKRVVDWFVPKCSLQHNKFNDPRQVLGRPNAGGNDQTDFHGFFSLGDNGYVTVDMETCAAERPGRDIRVYQTVSSEAVTLSAAGQPAGPFILVQEKKPCDNESEDFFSNYCDFDLSSAEMDEARYFKIQDGENFPCPGGSRSEGADIDAIEILNAKP